MVCKNEQQNIGRTLRSLQGLTDDIVVLDNGSTDNTKEIIRERGARLVEESWQGFGKTKNKAIAFAKYDWVLSLDADEPIDEELKDSLLSVALDNDNEVFELKFKNFLGSKYLRFGEWGRDKHIRLFNRKRVRWNEAEVHEGLILPPAVVVKKLRGFVIHHTAKDEMEFTDKMLKYALLNAEKYARQGKKSSWLNIYGASIFSFIKNYVFKLGFLDGRAGYICAKMNSYYTFTKYARLLKINRAKRAMSVESKNTRD